MKPRKIRRNIQSQDAGAERDGPRLGQVTRMRNPEGTQEVRWTRRRDRSHRDDGKANHKVVWAWSILFTVATILVIVGFSTFWMRSQRKSPVMAGGESLENVRIASQFESPGEDEALALVRRALANRDPERVETLMRPGETTPDEVVEFMAGLEETDGGIERISWLSSMDVGGMLMEGALVILNGGAKPVQRLALLVPDDKGVWKMDFEGFARTSRPSWKDFLEGRAESARVRVLTAKDSYYNGPFRDEDTWLCFGLVAPEAKEFLTDGQELLRGYCRKESPQAQAMERIFKDGSRMRRTTLELRRTENADLRQFEITRVLSEEWVLPETPFDEKFN